MNEGDKSIPAVATTAPALVDPTASNPTPVAPAAGSASGLHVALSITLAIGVAAMVAALFLPWTSLAGGASEGLAEYGAPLPSVVAWVLLAFGLALSLVAAVSFVFGAKKALAFLAVGSFLYTAGALVWYVATVLPSVVAMGCTTNPGTLCNLTPGSPTIPSEPGPGFVIAIASACVIIGLSVLGLLLVRQAAEPLPPE